MPRLQLMAGAAGGADTNSDQRLGKERHDSDNSHIKYQTTLSLLSLAIVPPGQLWDAFQGRHRILEDKRTKLMRCSSVNTAPTERSCAEMMV